jgi:hypothetical protein
VLASTIIGKPRSEIEKRISEIDNKASAVRYRAARLASAVRTTSPPDRLIELLLLLKERGESDKQYGTLRQIASTAAASASDIVIDAAIRSPYQARDLLFLIASGTAFAENAGAQVLARKQHWPLAHMGYFWSAVIASRDLDPVTLAAELVRSVGSAHNPTRSIISALARRQDFEAVLAPHLPRWVTQAVIAQCANAPHQRQRT